MLVRDQVMINGHWSNLPAGSGLDVEWVVRVVDVKVVEIEVDVNGNDGCDWDLVK